MVGHFDAVN